MLVVPAGTGADDLPCLWVRGERDVASLLRQAVTVTVTGALACTAYGAHLAAELAAGLAAAGRWLRSRCASTIGSSITPE